MKRITSKKGVEGMYRIMIGIIMGAMLLFVVLRVGLPALTPTDTSLKTFNALADKIEQFQNTSSGYESQMATQFTTIKPDEPWLFFDREVNFTASAFTDITMNEFQAMNNQIIPNQKSFGYYLGRATTSTVRLFYGSYGGVVIYARPNGCGHSACMAICKNPTVEIFRTYDLKVTEYSENVNDQAIVTSLDNYDISPGYVTDTYHMNFNIPAIKLIKCTSAETRTFDNIDKFYRRPVFTGFYQESATDKTWDSVRAFGHGFSLESAPFAHSGDWQEGKVNKISFDTDAQKLILYEINASTYKVLLESDFFTLQSFNNIVVGCYQPPCLNNFDEFYLQWQNNILKPCLSSSSCAALEERIKNVNKLNYYQKISLEETTSERGKPQLNVYVQDQNEPEEESYPFNYNVNLRVFKVGDRNPTAEPKTIQFSKRQLASGTRIVAMTYDNSEDKLFKSAYSPTLKEGETVRNLDFYYEDIPAGTLT
jgi:hypothetical protein